MANMRGEGRGAGRVQELSPNIILILFLPTADGAPYTSQCGVTLTNKVDLTIQAATSVGTPATSGIIIDCGSDNRFVEIFGGRVTLIGLHVTNGEAPVGGILFAQNSEFKSQNCTYTNSTSTCVVRQSAGTNVLTPNQVLTAQYKAVGCSTLDTSGEIFPIVGGGGAL